MALERISSVSSYTILVILHWVNVVLEPMLRL